MSWGFVLRENQGRISSKSRLPLGKPCGLECGEWGTGKLCREMRGAVEVTQVGGAGRAGRWEEGVQEAASCRPGDWLSCGRTPSGFRPGSPASGGALLELKKNPCGQPKILTLR